MTTPLLNRTNKTDTEQQEKENEQKLHQPPPAGFPDDFPHHSINSDLTSTHHHHHQQPTPSSSSTLMYHGTTAKKQLPTPKDSEARKCWICYDDDDENPSDHKHKKRWVKPCRCSLVAHESCLLTWITTYQLTHPTPASISSPLLTPVKCPQCSSTYQISQPASPVLSLIHRLRRPYQAAISWCALGSVILGVGVSASSYGLWASRCFLGPARWNRWIANPHQSRGSNFLKFFQLSLVGPILILSRTKQLDSVLPFLPISLIFSTLPPLNLDGDLDRFNEIPSPLKLEHIFPPEPGLTLCLIPWMRIGWSLIWTRISEFVLDREYACMNYQYPLGVGLEGRGPVAAEPNNQNDQVDPMVANNNNQGLDPPGGGVGGEEEPNDRAAAEVVLDYSSLRTILRIGMEALIWPGAASVVGSLLLISSRNRAWLQTLLGLKPSLVSSSFINPTSYYSNHQSSSPISKLFTSVKSWISQLIYNSTSSSSTRRLDFFSSSDSLLPVGGIHPEDDPVWWRNTLGGSLLVIIKDLLSLLERVLRLRKLKYRRVLNVDQIESSSPTGIDNTTTTSSFAPDI